MHTPGPRVVTELDPAPMPGYAYAVGHDPLGPSDVPWPIALYVTPADARLSAAAPDLLAALEAIYRVASSPSVMLPGPVHLSIAEVYAARDAIAAAKEAA